MAATDVFDEAYFVGATKSNYVDYAAEAARAIDDAFMPVVSQYAAHCRPTGRAGAALDLGCAMGFYVERLAADGWDAHGVDVSAYAIEQGRRRGVANLELAGADELPHDDASFDYVTCIDVIEHMDPASAAAMVAETRRVLRDGGIAFFATPNYRSNVHWNQWSPGFHDPDATHINYQSVESLRAHFREFAQCEIYGHTPFIGQFRAIEVSSALSGRGLDLPLVRPLVNRVGRRVAWRLLGRDTRYSSYLHAVAVR